MATKKQKKPAVVKGKVVLPIGKKAAARAAQINYYAYAVSHNSGKWRRVALLGSGFSTIQNVQFNRSDSGDLYDVSYIQESGGTGSAWDDRLIVWLKHHGHRISGETDNVTITITNATGSTPPTQDVDVQTVNDDSSHP